MSYPDVYNYFRQVQYEMFEAKNKLQLPQKKEVIICEYLEQLDLILTGKKPLETFEKRNIKEYIYDTNTGSGEQVIIRT